VRLRRPTDNERVIVIRWHNRALAGRSEEPWRYGDNVRPDAGEQIEEDVR